MQRGMLLRPCFSRMVPPHQMDQLLIGCFNALPTTLCFTHFHQRLKQVGHVSPTSIHFTHRMTGWPTKITTTIELELNMSRETPAKRRRYTCSKCHNPGHNSRNCWLKDSTAQPPSKRQRQRSNGGNSSKAV